MHISLSGHSALKLRIQFIAAVLLATATLSQARAAAGVDPWVEQQLAANAQVEFIVRLKAQGSLNDVRQVQNVLERRTLLVERLRATAAQSQADLLQRLRELGVPHRSFWITNAVWVRGDLGLLNELRQRNDVAHIHANPEVPADLPAPTSSPSESPDAVEWNITLIGAPDVWNEGVTGQNVVIGGQDTGYDWDHPALVNQYRGWDGANADHNYNWHDSIHTDNPSCDGDSPEPCDDHNHGTHTLGTMVGDDGGSNQIGVAPGARWIGCRNMNQGDGTPASYTECFQWFVAPTDLNGENPDPSKAPHVISNSWACPVAEGCDDPDMLRAVVSNTVDAGILVVVSAGNEGPGCSSTINQPGIYELSFSVGSTTMTDGISSFSSRGPVTVDGSGRMKPDISAPGSSVRSSIRNGSYGSSSGTSMAAPHVAGLAALMISADPKLAGELATIRSRIEANAVQLTSVQECGGVPGSEIPNNTFGHGRIDAMPTVFPKPEEYFKQGFENTQ
jgi:subtilisin family serine protease